MSLPYTFSSQPFTKKLFWDFHTHMMDIETIINKEKSQKSQQLVVKKNYRILRLINLL
jgi:hypothetical protein